MINQVNNIFTFDKCYHISHNQDYFCCVGTKVNLYDFKTGELVCKFKDIKQPNYSKFTSDGRLIVKTTSGKYYLYDIGRMVLVKTLSSPLNVKSSTTEFQVTSDNKYIIDFSYVFPTCKLLIVEIETGIQSFFDLGYARNGLVFSTEFGSKYYVIVNCAETIDASDVSVVDLYELSYRSGEFLLQKMFENKNSKFSVADYHSNAFVVADYSNKIRLFDIQKNFLNDLEYPKEGVLYDLKFSSNGQLVALIESGNVYVYDILNKECIFSHQIEYGCFVDFLDDSKLLVGTWEKGFCLSFR